MLTFIAAHWQSRTGRASCSMVVSTSLLLGPHKVIHVHEVRHRNAVLLCGPDLEDGVLIRELIQDEPLNRHGVVVLDEPGSWLWIMARVRVRVRNRVKVCGYGCSHSYGCG